jgi:agmatine deiminase
MIADWDANGVFLADMLKVRHLDLFTYLHSKLVSHGVEVRLLTDVRDFWARDCCPIQVGHRSFVKFRYDPDYLKDHAELRTGDDVVKAYQDLGECLHSPIVLDGGNIVASRTRAILTEKIYKENPDYSRGDLREELQRLLQVEQLIVIPREPYDPIGHADAMVRFIDEDTVLVNDYAKVDPAFGDRLAKTLRRRGLEIVLLPYFFERRSTGGIPSAVGCYANFIRTEKVVVVPIFGHKLDRVASNKLEAVFRGIPVVFLECTSLARKGGILNCISAIFRSSPTDIDH